MIKNVHLGFFINEYNSNPIYYDLALFKDADELDHFMDYFYNDNENLRKLFDQDISEYSIDRIEQFKEVEKISNKKFRGRISAYYFNEKGQLEFLDLPTAKRKPIRDYKRLPNLDTAYKYISNVFNEAVNNINARYKYKKTGPTKYEFIHYICEKLKQTSYEVSDNEKYYLAIYYNRRDDKHKADCLTLIKSNLKVYYKSVKEEKRLQEEQMRYEEEMKKYEEEITREYEREKAYDLTDEEREMLERPYWGGIR